MKLLKIEHKKIKYNTKKKTKHKWKDDDIGVEAAILVINTIVENLLVFFLTKDNL